MKTNGFFAIVILFVTMFLLGATSASAAKLATDADSDGIGDSADACPNQTRLPAGAVIGTNGCVADWGFCHLVQLQVGESPDACGVMPKGFTWHDRRYAGELENTAVRIDKYGREVRTGRFNGLWDSEKGRFVQAEEGLYGYEAGSVFRDHKRLGASVLRAESPVFWSVRKLIVTGDKHPITSAEVLELKVSVTDAQGKYDAAKRAYDDLVATRGEDARELKRADDALVLAVREYKAAKENLERFELRLGDLEKDVETLKEGADGMDSRLTTLETARDQNRLYVEGGYAFVYERWNGILPGGLILDIAPSSRLHIGAGHEFRNDRMTVRGIVNGGLNLRYDASAVGASVGARVDMFHTISTERVQGIRFGGSLGISVDWYHLGTGLTQRGVYSTSLGLRLTPRVGALIEIPGTPLAFQITGGATFGPTWVGIHGINTPFARMGGVFGISFGGRFGPTK